MASVIINGRSVPSDQAVISIQDRGFRLGDGVFETIGVYGGVPYQFGFHISRMSGGLAAINIPFDTGMLQAYARQLLKENQVGGGLLRIQVSRGIGSQGYLPDSRHPQAGASWVMETMPLPELPQTPVTLWQASYAKLSPRALPVQYKLCQGLNSTLARMEAAENHCFDALLSNEQRHVCETSSGNLFWIKGNVLYTPALACGVLDGSMRSAILRLSPWQVQEVEATAGQMSHADAVFISNAAWKLLPVSELKPQGLQWKSEELAAQMRALIENDIESYCGQQKASWG